MCHEVSGPKMPFGIRVGDPVIHPAPRAVVSRNIERLMVFVWNKYITKLEFGLLPKEYNFKVHGPYLPWRYYGKGKWLVSC